MLIRLRDVDQDRGRFRQRQLSAGHVVIEHDFRPRLPGFAGFVDRFFTRPIAGRTLATFKALAEAVQSEAPPTANPST